MRVFSRSYDQAPGVEFHRPALSLSFTAPFRWRIGTTCAVAASWERARCVSFPCARPALRRASTIGARARSLAAARFVADAAIFCCVRRRAPFAPVVGPHALVVTFDRSPACDQRSLATFRTSRQTLGTRRDDRAVRSFRRFLAYTARLEIASLAHLLRRSRRGSSSSSYAPDLATVDTFSSPLAGVPSRGARPAIAEFNDPERGRSSGDVSAQRAPLRSRADRRTPRRRRRPSSRVSDISSSTPSLSRDSSTARDLVLERFRTSFGSFFLSTRADLSAIRDTEPDIAPCPSARPSPPSTPSGRAVDGVALTAVVVCARSRPRAETLCPALSRRPPSSPRRALAATTAVISFDGALIDPP